MSKKKYKLDELPVYEILIDDEDETGIRYLSIVQDPAIEMKGMYFNDIEVKEFRFFASKEQQKIVGPALIPYKKIYRVDEDGEYFVMFTPETIRMYGYELPKKSWFVEVKIDDTNFWNTFVKEDGFFSFSIEGILGQRLVAMATHMDFYIDALTEGEIMELYNEFVIEPKSGESEDEFIGRCIANEINAGYENDQAAAICYSKWNEMGSDKKKAEKLAESYTDYPQAASENAKIALRWVDENGWGDCGTAVGKIRANQLANREPISRDTIARMAAFARHLQWEDKQLGDGCGKLMLYAWGGREGIEYAQRKLKEIDEEKKK